VKPGDHVAAGQTLYRFAAPDLDQQLVAVQWQIQVLRYQNAFQIFDQQGVQDSLVVRQQLQTALAREAGLRKEKERLTVKAPFAGIVVDQADPLAPGEWVAEGEQLATLIAPQGIEVESFVAESDLSRLSSGATARFFGEDPRRASVPLMVTDIERTALRTLAGVPELASVNGGGIAAVAERGQAPVPEGAVYRVLLKPDSGAASATDRALRGTVLISGEGRSLLASAWTAVSAVVIRETGF
jgi:putative peptide zinc metalloprotease protein